MRVHSNAVDILGNALSITQILCLLMYSFIHKRRCVHLGERRKQLNPATDTHPPQTPTSCHNLPCYKPYSMYCEPYLFTSGVKLSIQIQVTLLHHFIIIHKLQSFQSHFHKPSGLFQDALQSLLYINMFLSHLIHVKLCFCFY